MDQNVANTSSDDTAAIETPAISFDNNFDTDSTLITTTSQDETVCHDIVTTTTEVTSQPQTLYVAIQPPSGSQSNNGEVSEDQPAVYVEVVEASNLAGQMTSDGQMIIAEQSKFLYNIQVYSVGDKVLNLPVLHCDL